MHGSVHGMWGLVILPGCCGWGGGGVFGVWFGVDSFLKRKCFGVTEEYFLIFLFKLYCHIVLIIVSLLGVDTSQIGLQVRSCILVLVSNQPKSEAPVFECLIHCHQIGLMQ